MKKAPFVDWLWQACRSGLGFLFVLAAASKLHDPLKFMGSLENYGVVHGAPVALGALALPGIELVCGLALLLRFQVRAAALLISGMLVLFMGAIGWAMAHGVEMDCSCFNLAGALGAGAENLGPVEKERQTRLFILGLAGLYLALHALGRQASGEDKRWPRQLLQAALAAWTAFGLMGAGAEGWMPGLVTSTIFFSGIYFGFVSGASSWKYLELKSLLRDLVLLGPLAFFILVALGTGQANLGWRTLFRDLAMLLPALWLALSRPQEN